MNETKVVKQDMGKNWVMYQGDSCEVLAGITDNSIDFMIFSPPFSNLYIYSDSSADLGNSADDEEFFQHYQYIIDQTYRALKPGRLVAVHCKDLPLYMNRDGAAGLSDFPGRIIRAHEQAGFTYHSRVTIWKDPVIEMQRTKNHGLLHKNWTERSEVVRQGMADYLIIFRKFLGLDDVPDKQVIHRLKAGTHEFQGENRPSQYDSDRDYSIQVWQRYASPVWWDIRQTRVLNIQQARDGNDEKHICLARGSLVLTDLGFKPIQDVQVGNLVLTHKGRWRSVIAVQNTGVQKVVTVKAQGVPGLTLTPEHKIWTRKSDWIRERDGAEKAEPAWIPATEVKGGYVNLKLPPVRESSLTPKELWLLGRWLADGHVGVRGEFCISVGHEKLDHFIEMAGDCAGTRQVGTSTQIRLKNLSTAMTNALKACGKGAANKQLPVFALALPQESARALLDGYLSGDGHYVESRGNWLATSVSKALSLGIAMLVQRAYGVIASVFAGRPAGKAVIEGREVSTLQEWKISFDLRNEQKTPFILDDGAWKKVRSVEESEEVETWNLRVLDDESYTAEGCVVKNCPLQLDVISRAVDIWTNPGDVVLSPFAGIGSEGYESIRMGRKFIGIELKESYFDTACRNLKQAEESLKVQSLFDLESVTA